MPNHARHVALRHARALALQQAHHASPHKYSASRVRSAYEARAWSSEGCLSKGVSEVNGCTPGAGDASSDEASSGAAQSITCAYALRCECTHLTDFAGIAIPTSLDEVLAQLEPTITLPCPDGFFAPFDFMKSPFLYSLIKGLTLMNLISIAFFRWRFSSRLSNHNPNPHPPSLRPSP